MADEFVSHFRYRLTILLPLIILGSGIISAFSLVYVRLPWFFFGPSVAAGFLAITVSAGDESNGGGPIRSRIQKWVQIWPVWEYVVTALLLVAFLVLSVVFGFWGSVLFGGAVGIALGLIFFVAVTLPLKEQRVTIENGFGKIVQLLRRYGISPLEIEMGTPKLLGVQWMPLFEQVFGYDAYRSVSQQIAEKEPELMRKRRWMRDSVCDLISHGVQHRTGPFGTLSSLRKRQLAGTSDRQTLNKIQAGQSIPGHGLQGETIFDSELPSDSIPGQGLPGQLLPGFPGGPSDSSGYSAQEPNVRIDAAHSQNVSVNATNIDLDALSINNLNLLVGNQQLDTVMQDEQVQQTAGAGSRAYQEAQVSSTGLTREEREKMRRLHAFLGDEARLTIAFLASCVFGFWVFQSGVVSDAGIASFQEACSQMKFQSLSQIGHNLYLLQNVATGCVQEIWPLGISGWSFFFVSCMLFASSVKRGWQFSLFVLPAALVLIGGMSATLVHGMGREAGWVGLTAAIVIFLIGLLWERTAMGRRYAIYNITQ